MAPEFDHLVVARNEQNESPSAERRLSTRVRSRVRCRAGTASRVPRTPSVIWNSPRYTDTPPVVELGDHHPAKLRRQPSVIPSQRCACGQRHDDDRCSSDRDGNHGSDHRCRYPAGHVSQLNEHGTGLPSSERIGIIFLDQIFGKANQGRGDACKESASGASKASPENLFFASAAGVWTRRSRAITSRRRED